MQEHGELVNRVVASRGDATPRDHDAQDSHPIFGGMELLLIMGVLLLVIWVSVLRPSPDDLPLYGVARSRLLMSISICRSIDMKSGPLTPWIHGIAGLASLGMHETG